MKLLFKQRFFSWFDSYDIYYESGETAYEVKGQLSWGHCLKIFDPSGNEVGTVKERVFTFLPAFELYAGNEFLGSIRKEFSLFTPRYNIVNTYGTTVATVSKELLNWTDTYVLDVANPNDALYVLMFVLAIDAEKCSRKKKI